MIFDDCREKAVSRPGWKCYCHPFASTSETEKYTSLLTELMEEHQVDLDKIIKDRKLIFIDSKTDKNSIFY